MPLTTDILDGWRKPARLIRQKLDEGLREDRALAVCMGACGLIFLSQLPLMARGVWADQARPEAARIPMDARMGGALMGTIFLLPLVLYAIGAVSHLAARALGGRGGWFGARLALFWALLAAAPAILLNGLAAGFLGPGPAATAIGAAVGIGFVYLWISMLIEAERAP